MSTHIKSIFPSLHYVAAFMLVFACAAPVQAENIVAMVDEHGHTVYVNAPSDVGGGKGAHSFRPVRSANALPPAEINRPMMTPRW